MSARIPLKHPGRRRYWRDRRVLEDLKQQLKVLDGVIADTPTSDRREWFERSRAHLQASINEFEKGWKRDYMGDQA